MHCTNINHQQIQDWAKEFSKSPEYIGGIVSLWQESNNRLDEFPSKLWMENQITNNSLNQNNTLYQKQTQSSEGQIASEKTIRDLAARMSDRIGMPVKFESDRSKEYKGKLENGTAIVNLAYATLDTVPHEILAHPIIRALKIKSEQSIDVYLQEMIGKGIITKEC